MEEGRNNKRFGPIPVKEGETHEVEIEGIGEKGDGIARVNGYVIIVPNVQKGDKVKVKVNAVRGKVSFGEVIERTGGETGTEKTEGEDESAEEPNEESDESDSESSGGEAEDSEDTEDTKDEEDEEKKEE